MRVGAMGRRLAWSLLGLACALALGTSAPAAQASFDDPLFIVRPAPPAKPPMLPEPLAAPPPVSRFEGPCGLAVDGTGRVLVADYYHRAIDFFGPDIGPTYPFGYEDGSQLVSPDPLDGPCGLAIDGTGTVYANVLHRSIVKFSGAGSSVLTGVPVDEERPTGVAVDPATDNAYVSLRRSVRIYQPNGAAVGLFGLGSLVDGSGLTVSGYPGTEGRAYVADAGDDTVKVYEPLASTDPVATIDGSGTPRGRFTSLRDSTVAVDDATGEVYVADNLEPGVAEEPETVVWIFDSGGAYEGRLKFSVVFSQAVGLAVDNSATANQSRVYVTSGNTDGGAVYVYPPGAATSVGIALPGRKPALDSGSSGAGAAIEAPAAAASAPIAAAPSPPAAVAPVAAKQRKRAKPKAGKRHRVKKHTGDHRHRRRSAR
jgi:hypothetical protein